MGDGARGRRGSNLPAELTSFVGRRQELREAKRLLATTRLLTLTGSGGAGKTRLALRAAAEMSRGFPDGTWLVSLGPVHDPLLVPQAVFGALGVHDLSAGLSRASAPTTPMPIPATGRTSLPGRLGGPAGPSRTWSTPARLPAALSMRPARRISTSSARIAGWSTAVSSTTAALATTSR